MKEGKKDTEMVEIGGAVGVDLKFVKVSDGA